jgi:predicted helicase
VPPPHTRTAQHSTAQHSTAQHITSHHITSHHIIANQQDTLPNLIICLSLSATKGFSVLMTDTLPDLHLIGDAQCFPMFLYDTEESQ